jgi:regulator of protease activity HflC (stomatin/prohibitin superfamily)
MEAISFSAQTALRESIGRHELAQMITEREILGRELQRILDEKTNPWGITVQSVEIRDVRIPQALEDAMSRQAQAERERQARIILGQAETEISDKFVQPAAAYTENPGSALARYEHAVRSDQRARFDGDRAVISRGDDGAWRESGNRVARRSKTLTISPGRKEKTNEVLT